MAEKDPKKEALETASIISDALSSIAAQVSDIFANALAGTDRVAQTVTKDIQKRFNDMAKVTDDIATNALKLKEGLIKTDTVEKQILNRKIKQEALGSQLVTLLKQQGVEAGNIEDLIEGQNNGTIRLTRSQKALVNEYVKSKGFNDEYISQLQEQLEKSEEIEKSVGVTGKLLKGLSKIPVVGQFIDAEKANTQDDTLSLFMLRKFVTIPARPYAEPAHDDIINSQSITDIEWERATSKLFGN